MDDAFYYNALAEEEAGSYAALKKLRDSCDGNWESVYQKYKKNNPIVHDPGKKWKKMESSGMRLVLLEDTEYPPLLKEISNPPFGIYVRGELRLENVTGLTKSDAVRGAQAKHRERYVGIVSDVLRSATKKCADFVSPNKIPIAIVGTRKATGDGTATARRFADTLARAGFVIISGLAFGIDASAHEGCLDAGGTTIAVLASGADVVSPRGNVRLAERILKNGGMIISEYPPGAEAQPYRFLERNRIISGLSKGVLVIEAPESSGALATVGFATEQNRDVFVVPGPIAHPNFVGSHHLIRNGAELITKPEHVMEAYGIIQECACAENNSNDAPYRILPDKIRNGTAEEKTVFDALRANVRGTDVDKIIIITKLEPRTVSQTLSFLLIKGLIKEIESGYVIK